MAKELSSTIKIDNEEYNINAVNADLAEDSQKLGGVPANDYATKGFVNDISTQTVIAAGVTFGKDAEVEFVGDKGIDITSDGENSQIKISYASSVANHYTPTADSAKELSADANSTTSANWGTTDLVTGINIKRDAKGHVTGVTVDSVQMPANPDTHNSHAIISGKKSDGTTDIKSTASSGDITLGDSGVTAGEYGPTSNQTPNYGATFNVPDIKVNSKGIVTAISNKTVKIPASDNSESTITIEANTKTPSETDLAYAITALTPEGTAGHTIKPTYTEFPTKKYVDDTVAGAAFGETQLGLIQEQIDNSIGNGTLTIKKNGTIVGTFDANSKTAAEVNIVDNNTTYALTAPVSKTNGDVTINLTAGGSGSGTDSVTVNGTGATTVTTDASGIINISSPNALKNPNTLSIGGKSYDGSSAVSVTAAELRTHLGINNALHFIGLTTTAITDNNTTKTITVDEKSYTAVAGDVVLYNDNEYVFDGSKWLELGDGSSHALKTITITAGNGLTGGGDISANRTLNVVAGNGITVTADAVAAKAGNGITVDSTGIHHADTSSQDSITANTRKYISGVTLDTYGHVTGLTATDLSTLISHGTADPTGDTISQYYFKY